MKPESTSLSEHQEGKVLLSMQGIRKRFQATQALSGVSLTLHEGEVLALLGENGAGKSTLMKILSGAHHPDEGVMTLDGKLYLPQTPLEARQSGVAMIYQELNLAPDLTVAENIMLGQELSRFGVVRRGEEKRLVREKLEVLGHPDLDPNTPVCELSPANQQIVEIARALASRARVIVFDEPTSSLTHDDVERLFTVIRRLQSTGIGIIYISHFLEEIQKVCQTYCVLRDGIVAGTGNLSENKAKQGGIEETILSLMIGKTIETRYPHVPHTPGDVVLRWKGIDIRRSLDSRLSSLVSGEVRRGEIYGISGLVGAGRTELLRGLLGLDSFRGGIVEISGKTIPNSIKNRAQAGLSLVSEDRKGEGLAQLLSIEENLTLSSLTPYTRFGFLRLGSRRKAAQNWMRKLEVKAHSAEQEIRELSGGNQQKVALARVLHEAAEILLLDEPTRGIDIGTKAEIYRIMGELAAEGKAILFVSSYFNELLAVCDRIAVIARGRLVEIRNASDWTEQSLMQAAFTVPPNEQGQHRSAEGATR